MKSSFDEKAKSLSYYTVRSQRLLLHFEFFYENWNFQCGRIIHADGWFSPESGVADCFRDRENYQVLILLIWMKTMKEYWIKNYQSITRIESRWNKCQNFWKYSYRYLNVECFQNSISNKQTSNNHLCYNNSEKLLNSQIIHSFWIQNDQNDEMSRFFFVDYSNFISYFKQDLHNVSKNHIVYFFRYSKPNSSILSK